MSGLQNREGIGGTFLRESLPGSLGGEREEKEEEEEEEEVVEEGDGRGRGEGEGEEEKEEEHYVVKWSKMAVI